MKKFLVRFSSIIISIKFNSMDVDVRDNDFTVFFFYIMKSLVSLHLKQLNQECLVIIIIGVDFDG